MKVLVTGAAGYLGSTLVGHLLEKGWSVTAVDNLRFGQHSLFGYCGHKKFSFERGDIRNFHTMERLIREHDVLVPLAAIVGAPACAKDPELAHQTNYDAYVWLTTNMSKDQIVIFPTTNSGYGVGAPDELCTENSPLRPVSEYGRNKVEIEKMFLSAGNAITFRLATVFGMSPRMRLDLLVNDFVYRAVKEGVLVLFEEHFRRNFIHVRDVASAFIFGIEHCETMRGLPFNVGLSSANITKRELAEKIKELVPNLYIHSAAIGEDPDKRDYLVSNERLESLGWEPKHSLGDGIRELICGYSMFGDGQFTNLI